METFKSSITLTLDDVRGNQFTFKMANTYGVKTYQAIDDANGLRLHTTIIDLDNPEEEHVFDLWEENAAIFPTEKRILYFGR